MQWAWFLDDARNFIGFQLIRKMSAHLRSLDTRVTVRGTVRSHAPVICNKSQCDCLSQIGLNMSVFKGCDYLTCLNEENKLNQFVKEFMEDWINDAHDDRENIV